MLSIFKTNAINIKNVNKVIFSSKPFFDLENKIKKNTIIILDNFFKKKINL